MYNRSQVYASCLLAISKGVYIPTGFGNACSARNKGEFKSDILQDIAARYFEEASKFTEQQLWEMYIAAKK
jgi:hypothetical protein